MVPAPVRLLVVALASGCMPASSPTVRSGATEATAVPAAATRNWVVTAALPGQRISRFSAGLAVGARGWATLAAQWETVTSTLFYPLTPDPEDPDLLVVDSPLSDEQVMTRSGKFLGVLAQDCEPTARPGECSAVAALAVSADRPAGPEPGAFPPVYLLIHVVADTHCAPATPRAFTVERSPCPGARPGDQRDCPAEAARDGGYQIGPFRVLLAAWVGMCGEPL